MKEMMSSVAGGQKEAPQAAAAKGPEVCPVAHDAGSPADRAAKSAAESHFCWNYVKCLPGLEPANS